METTRNNAWTRTAPGALFAAAISSSDDCTVVAGAAAMQLGAELGGVAIVALIVPGFVLGRVLVMTH